MTRCDSVCIFMDLWKFVRMYTNVSFCLCAQKYVVKPGANARYLQYSCSLHVREATCSHKDTFADGFCAHIVKTVCNSCSAAEQKPFRIQILGSHTL